MIKRKLGKLKLEVSTIGLGCMGMSMAYGRTDDNQSIKTLQRAIANGATFLDTADMYGDGHNEELVRKALGDGYRKKWC